MNKILLFFTLFLLPFFDVEVIAQTINVSNVIRTGYFAQCANSVPTVSVNYVSGTGTNVAGGNLVCTDPCGTTTLHVVISNIKWKQVNAEWLHGIFFPVNAGYTLSGISIPAGFITYNAGCTGACGVGVTSGPGFYYDATAGNTCCGIISASDGNPCNNWGSFSLDCNSPFTLNFDMTFCNSNLTTATETFTLTGTSDGGTGCYDINNVASHTISYTINTTPCNAVYSSAPIATAPTRSCIGNVVNYTSILTGGCGSGSTISWYNSATGGTLLGTGSPFSYTPANSVCPGGTTVYASCCPLGATNCITRVPVLIPGTCNLFSITGLTSTPNTCATQGSITSVTTQNAQGTVQYSINPGGSTNTTGIFSGLIQPSYTVTATDAGGCSYTTIVSFAVIPVIFPTISNIISPTCILPNSGSFSVNTTGGIAPYSYIISPNATQSTNGNFSNISSQTYIIIASDNNSCTGTISVTISNPTSPVISTTTHTNVSCQGGNNGTIQVSAAGGLNPISYTLQPNNIINGTGSYTTLIAGIYTIIATDVNGCSTSTIVSITEPNGVIITATGTNALCNGGTGSITYSGTGGTGLITYTVNGTTQISPYVSSAGSYTVVATDVNGCSTSTVVIITDPSAVIITATGTNALCNGGNGSITYSGTGGTGLITYTVNGTAQTSPYATVAGSYTVVATDVNGCSTSTIVSITEPSAIQVTNINSTIPSCVPGNDAQITVTATGGVPSYNYNIGGANQTGTQFNNIGVGSYTVTVTDNNGCSVSSVTSISNPTSPVISTTTHTNVSCQGGNNGTIQVSAAGGLNPISYTLQPNNIINGTGSYTTLIAGIYTIIATDVNGCSTSTIVSITEPNGVIITATGTNALCNGGTGSITYSGTGGTGLITYTVNGTTQISPYVSSAGSYTVVATDVNGCSTSTVVIITDPSAVIITATGTNALCNGGNGSITYSGTGGTGLITYTVNGTAQTSPYATVAGSYTVVATDVNGCSTSTIVSITEPSAIQVTNINSTIPSCVPGNDAQITVTATGGVPSYNYNIGGANQTGTQFNNIGVGSYTVTVTDNNGCSVSSVTSISNPTSPVISTTTHTNVSCQGGNNGTIQVSAAGGLNPISYTLQPNNIINGTGSYTTLIAGIYTIIATDVNGCSTSTIVSITEPNGVIITATGTNALCNGGTGSITYSGTGGTGLITYTVNGTTQISPYVSSAGSYTVVATDVNGCSTSTVVIITDPSAVIITATGTNALCNGGNGSITYSGTGGTGLITYTVNGTAQTSPYATVAGSYTVVATDVNGCSTSTIVSITEPSAIQVTNINSTIPSCVPGNDAQITVTATGGVPSYNYNIGGANQTGTQFNNIGVGSYTVTVTDNNGCSVSSVTSISNPTSPVISTTTHTNVSCQGGNNGTIQVSAAGGLNPISYTLQPNNIINGTGSYTTLIAGIYTIIATDVNGCSTSTIVSITEPNGVIITATGTNALCNGGTGSITYSGTGGTGLITYTVNGTTQISPYVSSAGSYTVVATDVNGCSTSTVVIITDPSAVIITATGTNALCNGGNGSITYSGTGGTGLITYTVNGTAQTSPYATVAGSYTVVATDVNGCSTSTIVSITEPSAIQVTNINSTIPSCVPGNDAQITVTATGGVPSYNYNIGGANQTGTQFNNIGVGSYTVTVTDNNGCSVSSVTSISNPTSPVISTTTHTNVSCQGGNNGTIQVSAAGGLNPISYTLQPNNIINGTGSYTTLIAGIYTIIATDVNGCSTSTIVSITEPNGVIITATGTNALCNGGTGSITYSGTGGTGLITYTVNGTTQISPYVSSAGSYTVVATDVNGCSTSTVVIITDPSAVIITATGTNALCNGGNGSITYSGTGGTGLITYTVNGTAQTSPYATVAGSYTVVATDVNGCSTSTIVSITEPSAIQVTNINSTIPSCVPGNDAQITVTATGGVPSYNYNIGGANQTGTQFNNIGVGSYTVTVTDNNGCSVSSVTVISNPSLPLITQITTTNASCVPGCDGMATISATGGTSANYTYSIDNINFQNNNQFTNLCIGNYTATVKDASGCTTTSIFDIINPNAPQISNVSSINILCNGGNNASISIQSVGGLAPIDYNLMTGNITNQTGNFNNLVAGIYTVTVTDVNGCISNTVVNITQPQILQFTNVISNGSLCSGSSNGSIDVTTSGGTGVVAYVISPSATFLPPTTFTNLLGNTNYTITGTDINGCTVSTIVFVAQPNALNITNTSVTNITCNNVNDGQYNITAVGGLGTLTYAITPNPQTNTNGIFTGLAAANYTATVTDANGCTAETTFTIINPPTIVLNTISSQNISCFNVNDGTISINCIGGIGVINYNLQPTNITNTSGNFTNLSGNTYTVIASDANNCSYSTIIIIDNPTQINFANVNSTNILCAGNTNGTITAVGNGGTGVVYTYSITPQNSTNNTGVFNNLPATTYTLTVTDANGCNTTTSIVISEPLPLVLTLDSVNNNICFGDNNGAIYVHATNGTPSYFYTLQPTNITNANGTFNNIIAGTYIVSVADSNGCSTSVNNITITQPQEIIIDSLVKNNIKCYGDKTGLIALFAHGGTGALNYSISTNPLLFSTNSVFANLGAGNYVITVKDANNCTKTTAVILTQNPAIVINNVNSIQPHCHGDANGALIISANGGVGTLKYQLNNGSIQTTSNFPNLSAGSYLLSIFDDNNCRLDTLLNLAEPDPVSIKDVEILPVFCFGESDGKINITGVGGVGNYTYYLRPGIMINRHGHFSNLNEGIYTLTVKDSNGCFFDTIVTVLPPVNPINVTITKNDLGCFGVGTEGWAEANVTGGVTPYNYSWSTTPVQTNPRAENLFFGYYFLEVTDANGCIIKDTVYINPGTCCEEVFIPNAFSPNGDGMNDVFRVTTSTGIELIQFAVYDRWGNKVWSTFDFRRGWDGTYNGKNAEMSTYYYIFHYKCLTDGNTYTKKGDVTIVK